MTDQPIIVAYDLTPLFTGNWELLTAQHWGVLAGVVTYSLTVSVVIALMIFGGTCKRLREQAESFDGKQGGNMAAFATPFERVLLYDELLAKAATIALKPSLNSGDLKLTSHEDESTSEIVGETIVLRPYVPSSHLAQLHLISSGVPVYAYGPYDPEESLWRFFEEGPFASDKELGAASFMDDPADGRRFVVVDKATGYIVGMASLIKNSPKSLRIEVASVWITPAFQRTHVHTDLCITLMSHVFINGYRRVEWQCDAQNGRARKAAERTGFTLEGIMRKHTILRSSNSDTCMYSITNSDWRDGAREALAAKLRPADGISGPSRPTAMISAR